MDRRKFIKLTGVGMGGLMLPIPGSFISAAELTANPMDVAAKKQLADIALNAAKASGATYVDARIGRYLNQFITAQEKRISNVVNTESAGIGIRVIANGTWGFAATSNMSTDSIAKTAAQAVAVAKANSKFQVPLAITRIPIPADSVLTTLLMRFSWAVMNWLRYRPIRAST